MSENPGTLEQVARHLSMAVKPLREAVSDTDNFMQLMYRLGWEVESMPPEYEDLGAAVDAAVQALDALGGEPSPEDVLNLLGKVRDVYKAIRNISVAPPGVDAAAFLAEIGERLFELLWTEYLAAELPMAYNVLQALDVIQIENLPADETHHAFIRTRFKWAEIPKTVGDPLSILRRVYGWGEPRLEFSLILEHLAEIFLALGLPVVIPATEEALVRRYSGIFDEPLTGSQEMLKLPFYFTRLAGRVLEASFVVQELPASEGKPPGIVIEPRIPSELPASFTLSDSVEFSIRPGSDIATAFGVLLRPGDVSVKFPFQEGAALPEAGFGVTLRYAPESPALLLGTAGKSRLEHKGVATSFNLDFRDGQLELRLEAALEDLKLVIASANLDGFLGELLGGQDRTAPLPLTVRWSNKTGIGFVGGSGFQVSLPSNLRLGPVTVQQIQLALSATRTPGAAPDLILEAGASLSGQLGPLAFSVDNVGLQLVSRFIDGNAGPFDIGLGFKPPTGAGLAIDAAGVSGGGFLRFYPDIGRYDGALVLKLAEITVDAFGLVETRLPGGARGFSLAILFRGEFPPIQVGLGFVLTAVGGLIALNRRVDVDALRHRLASGTAGRILAPEDPIRNAPSLLADLGTVFPVAPGITVIGPTVRLVWADLVRFDIGVFLELPGPERVVILGSARASIEKPDGGRPYLVIRFDVVGVIDLQAGTVAFDAVLIDSQLLEILDLTGGAAFRLSWGNQPYAVLTVGGFNPAYNPEPLAFPSSLTRIAMVRGDPSDSLYLRFEGYFAVTTNTYQFGAAVEALINAEPFHIQGILQFDALIRRQPFHFQFDIRASVRVRYKTRNLGGLTLTGVLSGPGPVILRARVCIEILFFDICFEDTFTLGSSHPPAVTAIASAVAALTEELDNPANLRVSETVDRYVALRPSPPDLAQPVVSPLGQLRWVQHRAPLDLLLQRIGGAPLEEPQMVEATSPQLTEAELDWFAPGSFAELTDAEALNRRAFERLTGGLRFGLPGTDDGPATTPLPVTVRQIRLPAATPSFPKGVSFPAWLTEATFARIGGITDVAVTPAVAVREETWTIADAAGGVVAAGISAAQAHQLAALGPAGMAAAATDRIAAFTF